MAKGSKYHPLDVRYKGPSTAYRGSAKWSKTAIKPKSSGQETVSPWTAQSKRVPETKPSHDQVEAQGKPPAKAGRTLFWVVLAIIVFNIIF